MREIYVAVNQVNQSDDTKSDDPNRQVISSGHGGVFGFRKKDSKSLTLEILMS
jgi:hypothetical protein